MCSEVSEISGAKKRMTLDLIRTINEIPNLIADSNDLVNLPNEFLLPGFWAPFAAECSERHISFHQIVFATAAQEGYARAIKLENVLERGVDSYPHERVNCGKNYSPITALSCAALTDRANSTINSCLRHLCPGGAGRLNDLCAVVGELHDNVWSHGMSTGYSMAQKFVPSGDECCIEFSLADKGLGFKAEMIGSGNRVASHRDAIRWCIQRGNSTKLPPTDPWAQREPEDRLGASVYGPNVATYTPRGGNHHQGLGLAKLVDLVTRSGGELQIVSGNAAYRIKENGETSFNTIGYKWRGVAISCRLRVSGLLLDDEPLDADDEEINLILSRLKRG